MVPIHRLMREWRDLRKNEETFRVLMHAVPVRSRIFFGFRLIGQASGTQHSFLTYVNIRWRSKQKNCTHACNYNLITKKSGVWCIAQASGNLQTLLAYVGIRGLLVVREFQVPCYNLIWTSEENEKYKHAFRHFSVGNNSISTRTLPVVYNDTFWTGGVIIIVHTELYVNLAREFVFATYVTLRYASWC